MRFFGLFRKKPDEQAVVFAGDRSEAELVMGILREEGFHPREWADLPTPAYAGPIGMARIVVPPGEAEGARSLLASLEESAARQEGVAGGGGEEPGGPEAG